MKLRGVCCSKRARAAIFIVGSLSDLFCQVLIRSAFPMFLGRLEEAPEIFIFLPLPGIGKIVELSFLLEFQVTLVPIFPQVAGLNSHQNSAGGFLGVGAVGEAAREGKVVNI